MGTFHPNENDIPEDANACSSPSRMTCDDYESASLSSCFAQTNSLGNDYCPHSSQLFTLMESDESLSSPLPSLRKQRAVPCLTALAHTPKDSFYSDVFSETYQSGQKVVTSSSGNHTGDVVAVSSSPEDEWGQFAQDEVVDFCRSTATTATTCRLPTSLRRKSHQRRRFPAKYGRHGTF